MNTNVIKANLEKNLQLVEQNLYKFIPRYLELVQADSLTPMEISELGELEYFLMSIHARINHMKDILDGELFVGSLPTLFATKKKAENGDIDIKLKYEALRKSYQESLTAGTIIDWN